MWSDSFFHTVQMKEENENKQKKKQKEKKRKIVNLIWQFRYDGQQKRIISHSVMLREVLDILYSSSLLDT